MTSVLSMETTANPGNGFIQQCSSCDASSARCWCLDCDEALCDVCVSAHRRVTLTRSHRILNQPPAGGVPTPPTKFCRLHPSEPLKLFCFTCNQLTCRDCQLTAHMNHRYQFVSEAVGSLKKQLEVWVQPIRAHRGTARQSLLDMETRLQDVVQSESRLRSELHQSYNVVVHHMKKRMEDILKQVKKVCELESGLIQRRMMKLKQLQQNQQSVTETAEKAKNTNDLAALLAYTAQIKSQLKDSADQDSSPPQTMSQLKVVTDRKSLEAILNFGELEVSWIPFSVSQTSNQNGDTPAAAASFSSSSSPPPLTSTCSAPSCKPLPQTRTTNDTDSLVLVNCPSTSWKSSSNQLSPPSTSCPSVNQSNAPVTTPTAVTPPKTVECLSSTVKTLSHLGTNPRQVLLPRNRVQPVSTPVNLQLVSFGVPSSAGPSLSCMVLKPVQPSLVLNQSTAPQQNQSAAPLLTHAEYRLSCWPSSLPSVRVPMLLSQTVSYSLPGNTSSKQQENCGSHQILPVAPAGDQIPVGLSHTCPAPSCRPLPQTSATSATDSPVPVNCPSTSSKSSSSQLSVSSSRSCSTSTTFISSNSSHPSATPPTSTCLAPSCKTLPQTGTTNDTASPVLKDMSCTALTSDPLSSLHGLISDMRRHSSSLEHQQQSPVVRAVADSACDHSVPQVAARQREPAENEPTSTVSEETEPAGKQSPPEESDRDAEEPSSVIGHPDYSLSQWQPRVSLFRLPVSRPPPGRPLPGFRLVSGDTKDEIYLEEMSEDSQSRVDDVTDDITEPLSSPESPATLQMVSCSACGSANGSIICLACGRGYHRDCHVPPVGPDIWSEWICSLCQDLSDPSDPYSFDRPQRPQSPCLSLLDQRRCESLLLHLKVEGCSRCSELPVWGHVTLMSERLTLRRSPVYQTAAELLSDIWTLFKDASQDDGVLNKLQDSFQIRLMETFSPELHPSVLMPPSSRKSAVHDLEGSKVTSQEQEVITSETKLKTTRKRLRDLVGASGSKRTKTD
ncbi:E3 ubiquitin-protein ligase TRIM33 [Enoplosus armatus]|uniref:E3 ubiquitin-protein ligase TRIM33 n=1 Tax=Enoplosus armatus TaxID=215367 RepID=UPI00399591AE